MFVILSHKSLKSCNGILDASFMENRVVCERNANLVLGIMQENFHLALEKVYQKCEVKTTHAEEVS